MSLLFYVGKRRSVFYAVGASEALNRYRKRIDLRHNSVLTKDERLVVTTVLLNNTFCGFD